MDAAPQRGARARDGRRAMATRIRESHHAPLAAALAALIVGVGLYAAVPGTGGDPSGSAGATPAGARGGDGAAAPVPQTGRSGPDVAAGTGPAEAVARILGDPSAVTGGTGSPGPAGASVEVDGVAPDAPDAPVAPDVPDAPACPTEEAAATAAGLRRQVGDTLGQPVPGEAVADLAAIAAGCSNESPTGPVIRLALEVARTVPDTGLPPVTTPVLPFPPAPPAPVPPEVVEALQPAAPVVQEACGGIGMLGLLVAVLPGAAGVEIYDSNIITALGAAAALCGQFEPPT
jgi:hypothetical protein